MRDPLTGLDVFLAVAERRSFRGAGEHLGVTGSAVSQSLRQLEERLGVTLVERTTRSVALTEAGERLYRELEPAFAGIRASLASVGDRGDGPEGLLRLRVSSVAERFLTTSTLAGFLAEQPAIQVDVMVDDSGSDLVADGFDAGIRLGETVDPALVAVSVSGPQRQVVVAAPGYLAARGAPDHPRDLHGHACIGWRRDARSEPYRWEFAEGGRELDVVVDARVHTNDLGVMIRLARAGVGLTIGLEDSFRPWLGSGELVTVLEPFCPPFGGFYLYHPRRAHTPPKLAALVDYLTRATGRSARPGPRRLRRR